MMSEGGKLGTVTEIAANEAFFQKEKKKKPTKNTQVITPVPRTGKGKSTETEHLPGLGFPRPPLAAPRPPPPARPLPTLEVSLCLPAGTGWAAGSPGLQLR